MDCRKTDDTVLKVAIAGLIHDIGKFAEKGVLDVTADFLDRHAVLYQPSFKGQYTHHHAVYTAAFIEQMEQFLPRKFCGREGGLSDPLVNLASGHHKPETCLQWIIAMADRISSGWDRQTFDEEYNRAIPWRNWLRTRLVPLFERLLRAEEVKNYDYRYPLRALSPEGIFPVPAGKAEPAGDAEALSEYRHLFQDFSAALKNLTHREADPELWLDHLDSLMLIFTSPIPAARAGKVVPDVSLYDHSRAVAALSVALYLYHRDGESLTIDSVQREGDEKFLLIGGDFYGIQSFIFSDSGDTAKNRTKILRGRSFAVSLMAELASDRICRCCGLPTLNLLLNAAGKFVILAPNTKGVRDAVSTVQQEVNQWLLRNFYGECSFGLTVKQARPLDFTGGNFVHLWDALNEGMAKSKLRKFDLDAHGGPVPGYLDEFRNDLGRPLCPFCGKRPSSPDAEGWKPLGENKSACRVCRDHIFLGMNLVRQTRLAVTTTDAPLHDGTDRLLEPIFGLYQISFLGGRLEELAATGCLLRHWDVSVAESGEVSRDVTVRFLNGYIPIYGEEDADDDRILHGESSDRRKEELLDDIREGLPKTFAHLAAKALNPRDGNRYEGIQALGILKADVDHLGMIMACGLERQEFTLSRLATLSRQIHFFFALYLPHLLKTDVRFRDVYTVFGGGDDLFLIGPWNRIIDLAVQLRERFAEYACSNPEIHFSAGISLQKPYLPMDKMAEAAEEALSKAKVKRSSISLFGEVATWEEFIRLRQIRDMLGEWCDRERVNSAMLFRLNEFNRMAEAEGRVRRGGACYLEDLDCLKWRSLFRYTAERNIGRGLKGDEREEFRKEFAQVAEWLEEYGGRFKMALWDVIYNRR